MGTSVEVAENVETILRTYSANEIEEDGHLDICLNSGIINGVLGSEFKQKALQWFPGAKQDVCLKFKTPQYMIDENALDLAWERYEEGNLRAEPVETDYMIQTMVKFKVGMRGSIFVDLDVRGNVDQASVVKKTRVHVDHTHNPYKLVLDPTFEEIF